tara:strand:- start:3472 stop:7806 length:4335 start_codon:yes stop_codon:yes gene_type:complete
MTIGTPVTQITEPIYMFGAYVESFTSNVGYGAESSTMQMTLVEDPQNATQAVDPVTGLPLYLDSNGNTTTTVTDTPVMTEDPVVIEHQVIRLDDEDKPVRDSSGNIIYDTAAGFPPVGTVCQFSFQGFEFVGIFQRWQYSETLSGRKYDVTFESPSKLLEGVQVIVGEFEGTVFNENYWFRPHLNTKFTSQINNVLNPFGVLENYSFGGHFGKSDTNKQGFLVSKLLDMIEEITAGEYTYDNPNGPSVDTLTNSDDEELIGSPITFGDTQMLIDFKDLASKLPTDFRIKGPILNINDLVNQCMEIIVHDYVCIIDPVLTQVLTGYGPGIVANPQYANVMKNGAVPTQYDADDNVIGPVISFKYLDKRAQPQPGVVQELVDNAAKGNTLISRDNGQEYADVVTQKLMLGDNATRVWEAGLEHLIPVYGKDQNGNWLTGNGFGDGDYVPVLRGSGRIHSATVMELRAALSGYQTWVLYHYMGQYFGYSTITNEFMSGYDLESWQYAEIFQNVFNGQGWAAGFNGTRHRNINDAVTNFTARSVGGGRGQGGILKYFSDGDSSGSDSLFNDVLNTASNYYGRTYFVLLPVEPGGIQNNIRFLNDYDTESSWEMADAGWDPDFRVSDPDAYTDEGLLKAVAAYFPAIDTGTAGGFIKDFSSIERIVPYHLAAPVAGISTINGALNVEVENKIYWRNNPGYQQNNNPYDDISAMVHVTCPFVSEWDKYAVLRGMPMGAMAHFFATQQGRARGPSWIRNWLHTPSDSDTGLDPYTLWMHGACGPSNLMNRLKFMPKASRPFKISLPQKSTRYTWGPWYKYSSKKGKAEVEQNSQLRPEVFGSFSMLDKAAFALTEVALADPYATESGSVELAEFPQYNIAERFNTNGPYVTSMDVSVGTGGLTTRYQFSTWTRNFGKIAKYNVDRIARINKEKIKRLKTGGGGAGSAKSLTGSSPQVNAPMFGAREPQIPTMNEGDTIWKTGTIIPKVPKLSAAGNQFGKSQFVMSNNNATTLQFAYGAPMETGQRAYDTAFGCTDEQIFTPIGIRRRPNLADNAIDLEAVDVKRGLFPEERRLRALRANNGDEADIAGAEEAIKNFNNQLAEVEAKREILPYVRKAQENVNIVGTSDTFGKATLFGNASEHERTHVDVRPTAYSLDPYFLPTFVDFVAVNRNNYDWLTDGSKDNHLDLSTEGGTLLNDNTADVRTYGLRGPLLLSGWGYDLAGMPVPGNLDGFFDPVDPAQHRGSWKTGPVDLMWDDERQVWAGGLSFVEGVLKTSIGFAESVDKPNTEGRAVIRRRVRNDQVVNKRIADENNLVAQAQAIAVWNPDVDVDQDDNPDESLKAGDANNLPVPGRKNNADNGEKWRDQETKTAFINNRNDAAQDAELGRGLYEWKNLEEEVIITNRDPSLSASVETAEENGYDIYVMLVRVNYEWRPVWVSCDNISAEERGF